MNKNELLLLGAIALAAQMSAQTVYEVPYLEDFNSYYDIQNDFSVIDHNNDGNTWTEYMSSAYGAAEYDGNSNTADDYLVTPAIHLKPSSRYIVSFRARPAYKTDVEKIETSFGLNGADVTTYQTIKGPTEVHSQQYVSDYTEYTDTIDVTSDGNYSLAFHVISDANNGRIFIDDISVTAIAGLATPAAPTNFTVTPGSHGVHQATVSFNVPSTLVDGSAATSFDHVYIYRDSILAKDYENATASEAVSFTDTQASVGFHTYHAYAANATGNGTEVSDSTYVGEDVARDIDSVKLIDNSSSATLTWTVPDTTGVNGYWLDPSHLTYSVYDIDGSRIATGLTTNSYTINGIDQNVEQHLVQYSVTATNEGGESDRSYSNGMIVGRPFPTPFTEGFPYGNPSNTMWWTTRNNTANWGSSKDYDHDGNHGAATFKATKAGDNVQLITGKVSLEGTNSPQLSFWYYAKPGTDIQLRAIVDHATVSEDTVFTQDFKALTGEAGWRQAKVDLTSATPDDYITVAFDLVDNDLNTTVALDEIRIAEEYNYDLKATLEYPNEVIASKPAPIKLKVENIGKRDVRNYNVEFYAGDTTMQQTAQLLKAGDDSTFTFEYTAPVTSESMVNAYGVVTYRYDQDNDNDTTATAQINIRQAGFAGPENVGATANGSNVFVTWAAPDSTYQHIVDDFETYQPWIQTGIGDWTTIDGDSCETWKITKGNFPGNGGRMSFMVFNPTAGYDFVTEDAQYTPHSGKQYLISLSAEKRSNDDWLISPELSGKQQTISFYTRSLGWFALEDFDVLYSAGSVDRNDFIVAQHVDRTPADWTINQIELPEGAKRFAVHYNKHESMYGLILDDFSFDGAARPIVGYNIYRDGKLIATVDSDATSFTDITSAIGSYIYQVSAVYADGESQPSAGVTVSVTTGIDNVNVATKSTLLDGAAVYDLQGRKISGNAEEFLGSGKSHGTSVVIINGKKYVVK